MIEHTHTNIGSNETVDKRSTPTQHLPKPRFPTSINRPLTPAEPKHTLNQLCAIEATPRNPQQPCQEKTTSTMITAGDALQPCSNPHSLFTSSSTRAPFHKQKIKVNLPTLVSSIHCSKEPNQSTLEISMNWLINITQRPTNLLDNFSLDYSDWSKTGTWDPICYQTSYKTRN